MDDKPSMKGAWLRHVTRFISKAPSISQEWLKLIKLSNFVQGRLGAYQVLPKGWQITPKRGVVLLTWPIFVCITVELEKILYGTRWTAINNVVDDGLLIITPSTVDASAASAIHWGLIKLHRFDLSPCLLQTCLYNRQQIDQVEFEHYRSNMW